MLNYEEKLVLRLTLSHLDEIQHSIIQLQSSLSVIREALDSYYEDKVLEDIRPNEL